MPTKPSPPQNDPTWTGASLVPKRQEDGTLSCTDEEAVAKISDDTLSHTDESTPQRVLSGSSHIPTPKIILPERYEDWGLLGIGGMGEVRRVRDRMLDRMVAMKLVRSDRMHITRVRDHFAAEARATARLSHPGIVPVYDHGTTPDGRLWFTMQEIRGENVSELIARLHIGAGAAHAQEPLPAGFRRMVDVLERAARAVGYAHNQGFVHRDLKPSNLLVGEHGEVMVVDWGLVRPVGIVRGSVAGTPVYMAPEQARGGTVDVRSDVYGLGMVLWELCSGYHPFPDCQTETVLGALIRGEVPGPPPTPWRVPEEIFALIALASSVDPAQRPADGAAFADQLRLWLDGETRREKARARIQDARASEAAIAGLRAEAEAAQAQVKALAAENHPWEPDHSREALWAAEDRAQALTRQIAVVHREIEDALSATLIHDPDAIEAHALWAQRLRLAHADAEQRGMSTLAADIEVRLKRHAAALPTEHPDRLRSEAWLIGDGRLSLKTQPIARAELYRFVNEGRRLEPQYVSCLGQTPLENITLPHGSWLVELHAPGRAVVRYPVAIGREAHWDGVAPKDHAPTPIYLPFEHELGPNDIYVPAGWTDLGGDPEAPQGLSARRVWVDGFVIRRFPVTNNEYIAFLDDLVAQGQNEAAERYAPRDRGRSPGTWGAIFYGRTQDGRFCLQTDTDGDTWQGDWPVVMIDHVAAWAYAHWEAARSALPWRLPGDLEWEKAARGVDGRIYPWGNFADSTWCCNRLAFASAPKVEIVGSRPNDCSPYGVRDLAGGMVDWTASRVNIEGNTPHLGRVAIQDGSQETEADWLGRTATWRIVGKGGSRLHDLNAARSAFRLSVDPWTRGSNVSFRLARSIPNQS